MNKQVCVKQIRVMGKLAKIMHSVVLCRFKSKHVEDSRVNSRIMSNNVELFNFLKTDQKVTVAVANYRIPSILVETSRTQKQTRNLGFDSKQSRTVGISRDQSNFIKC